MCFAIIKVIPKFRKSLRLKFEQGIYLFIHSFIQTVHALRCRQFFNLKRVFLAQSDFYSEWIWSKLTLNCFGSIKLEICQKSPYSVMTKWDSLVFQLNWGLIWCGTSNRCLTSDTRLHSWAWLPYQTIKHIVATYWASQCFKLKMYLG